ncbi:MAG: redoxin domain-containing protein [Acidobacteria bacterium]|nr:redoxin domain-containing protein [Acidobacteriota bacterium]
MRETKRALGQGRRCRVFSSALAISLAVAWLAAGEERSSPSVGLPVGTRAPDFALSNARGERVSLADFRSKKNVALVFYPAQFRGGG